MKCTFCGDEIERGTGKNLILKEGKIVHLCSMKCEKNMFKLHRVARRMPWTAEYKAAKLVRLGLDNKGRKIVKEEVKKEIPKKTEEKKTTKITKK